MPALFSDQSQVQRAMSELNLSLQFVSGMMSGSPAISTLSLWLQGAYVLDALKARRLVQLCNTLRDIQTLHQPFPLSFKDVGLWQEILRSWDDEKRELRAQAEMLSEVPGEQVNHDAVQAR